MKLTKAEESYFVGLRDCAALIDEIRYQILNRTTIDRSEHEPILLSDVGSISIVRSHLKNALSVYVGSAGVRSVLDRAEDRDSV